MRDWADNPIVMFLVLRACLRVAPVGARSAGIILRCRRSEESVLVGLGVMPRERRDAAARVRRASRGRLRRRGDGQPDPRYQLGQAEAIPPLIRRTLNCTKAPILSNLRRMEPQVALAKCV